MSLVDLHLHTTHSDGSFTPGQLLRYCKEKKFVCVAVTDHDTMSSYDECRRAAEVEEIELIPGVEISVEFSPGTLHMLGYFVNQHCPELEKVFRDIQQARRERNPRIVEKLNASGIDITLEDVIRDAYGCSDIPPGKQLGRPHFANVLLKKRVVRSQEEAFLKYLAKGKPAYVDKRRLEKLEAITLIRRAGGIASLAHPKQMRLSVGELEKEVKQMVDMGLEAIEVYSSCHSARERSTYKKIAKKYGLLETGGSDFHGQNKADVDLGFVGKEVSLDYGMVEKLKQHLGGRKSIMAFE